jgi:sirohydrochlorin cobaltochelatase
MSNNAIVLFSHGARDPRWKEPIINVQKLMLTQNPDLTVELAFLELMTPSLEELIEDFFSRNINNVTLVPIFFGQGGHIREDLPKLIEACRQKYPLLNLTVKPAVGENIGVLQAIAKYCTDQ